MSLASKITVESGEHDRSHCPLSIYLPWSYASSPYVSLQEAKTRKAIPAQVSKSGDGIVVTWLADGLKAGQSQKYVIKGLAKSKPVSGNPSIARWNCAVN